MNRNSLRFSPKFVLFCTLICATTAWSQGGLFGGSTQNDSATQQQQQQQQQDRPLSIRTDSMDTAPLGPKDLNQSSNSQIDDYNNQNSSQRYNPYLQRNVPSGPTELTGFQRLVASSVGKVLPLYGASLFTNVPSTFAPVDRIPVTPDYVIGPGDELLIRLWGQVNLNGRYTVDRSGNVYIPQVGTIRVAGVSFDQLTENLRSQISRVFHNFDLNVNVGQLRSIQVFIVGNAKRPGSYTISSLSTLVNALFASGGPTPMGSMRNIQVRRGGQTVTTFDMYDLLLHGDKSKDVALLPGDVIYIPAVGPMIALAGAVNVPALYELKNEASAKEAIALAGGMSTIAHNRDVRIERIGNQNGRSVLDINLEHPGQDPSLADGDILLITPIIDRFKDSVTLRGNVADPRRFAWFPGMKVRDLIPDKDALLTRDYWAHRNQLGLPILDSTPDVRRYAADAPVTQINGYGIGPTKSLSMLGFPDTQGIYSTPDSDTNVYGRNSPFGALSPPIASTTTTAINGNNAIPSASNREIDLSSARAEAEGQTGASTSLSTMSPGNNPGSRSQATTSLSSSSLSASVTSSSQRFPRKNTVLLNAPEVDWEYAVIQRLDPEDLTTRLIPFNLGKAVMQGDATQNLQLEKGDVITIFSKADIRVPQTQQTKYVRLEGEFSSAGTYSVKPGETLRQLIARVGGLAPNAYLYGSEFTRESTRVIQQQRLSEYASELERRIKLAEASTAQNAINPQDEVANLAGLQNARTVAIRLRDLNATGRIVLSIKPEARTLDDIPDIALEDGDTFIVPQLPTNVDVFGAVYTQNSFLYENRMRAGDYIRKAGGGTRTADIHRSFIIRADGSVISRQYSSSFFSGDFSAVHLYPGDAIVVPEQVDHRPLLRNLVDIATIVGQFGLGIAAIQVLK